MQRHRPHRLFGGKNTLQFVMPCVILKLDKCLLFLCPGADTCRWNFAGQGARAVKKRRIILGVLLGVILLLVAGMVFMLAYGVWAYYNTFTSYSLQAILFLNSLPWLISIILLLPVYLVLRRRWKR